MASSSQPRRRLLLAKAGITAAALCLFILLRPDVAAIVSAPYREFIVSPRLINEYVRVQAIRKLQIGAGNNNLPGWLNTDIEPGQGQAYLDASKPFPLPDSSFSFIFSEHVIEHVGYEQARDMLKECYRVLMPGGTVRIATPNLVRFVELFQESKSAEMRGYMKGKLALHGWPNTVDPEAYILNLQLREWGHQFVYTPKMLRALLEHAGFRQIREFRAGESDEPVLANLEVRATGSYREVNAYETMVLQAIHE